VFLVVLSGLLLYAMLCPSATRTILLTTRLQVNAANQASQISVYRYAPKYGTHLLYDSPGPGPNIVTVTGHVTDDQCSGSQLDPVQGLQYGIQIHLCSLRIKSMCPCNIRTMNSQKKIRSTYVGSVSNKFWIGFETICIKLLPRTGTLRDLLLSDARYNIQ
jgi:hypothetical protein